jgi:AcrR family transcriptional regulator
VALTAGCKQGYKIGVSFNEQPFNQPGKAKNTMPKVGMEQIRREQVISATRRCIVEKGVLELSIKDVAAEAGVSTGVIYHYFKNKQDILLQVLKETFRKSNDQVMQTMAPLDSSKDKLFAHLENITFVPVDNPDFFLLLINYFAQAQNNQECADIIKKFYRNLRSFISQYLQQGVETDELDPELTGQLPVILLALGLGLGMMQTLDPDSFDMAKMESALKKICENALDPNGRNQ